METFERSSIQRNALEGIVGGLLGREGQTIGDGIASGSCDHDTGCTVHATFGDRYRLVRIALCPGDSRQGGGADRQRERIAGLLRREAFDRLTIETDACQIGVGGCLDLVGQFVGSSACSRRSRNRDLCTFLQTVLGECDGLCTIFIC